MFSSQFRSNIDESHLDIMIDCSRYAMREMHPLLGAAVGLQGGSSVHMTVQPLELHLPADCYTVRIQPMKMIIGSNAFLSSLMGLLKLRYFSIIRSLWCLAQRSLAGSRHTPCNTQHFYFEACMLL